MAETVTVTLLQVHSVPPNLVQLFGKNPTQTYMIEMIIGGYYLVVVYDSRDDGRASSNASAEA
jgi:hypothetical protein